jgi:hypothetical protein
MNLDDRQAAIADVRKVLEAALEALGDAESCETDADFAANIRSAQELVAEAGREMAEVQP